MRLWCDDRWNWPIRKKFWLLRTKETWFAPFHENYKLIDLPNLQNRRYHDLTDFKNHPDYDEMVADLQAGHIKFNTVYHKGHQEYMKNNTAGTFARSVEADLENVFEKQMGFRISYKEIAKRYKVFILIRSTVWMLEALKPRLLDCRTCYLNWTQSRSLTYGRNKLEID